MKKYFIGTFLLTLLVLSTTVLAQSNNTEPVSCFDHYKFGSVYASLETRNYQNTSGTVASFYGEIKNDNNYPIVDGKLFVKIMRSNDSYEKTGGQDEIDSFVVKEGISIPANSSIPIDFDWTIPGYAISGEYQVSTYFVVDDSFNMSGLPFSTDVVGGVVKFEVVGEQKEMVYFDRTNITLNDNTYYTVAFPPILSSTSTADIKFTLTNTTNQIQRVPVTIELYEWDGQAKKNLLDTKEVTYLVDENSSITVPYTVIDTKHSVYYVLAKAKYRDAKSEVSVRFGREGIEEPRINFSTFTQYPFVKGQENSLITCVHNTSNNDAEYGKVVTSVLDHTGKVIHTSTYEGKITSAMQGMISKFTPKAGHKDLKIETKIYDKNNNVIDETSVDYVCSSLSDDCEEPNLLFSFNTLITLLAIIIVVTLIIVLKKHMKKKDMIVVFALVFISGLLLMPREGEAKTKQWNWFFGGSISELSMIVDGIWSQNINDVSIIERPSNGVSLSNLHFSVNYNASVYDHDTKILINENSNIQSGKKIDFIFGPFKWSDIYWSGTGGVYSTPYGDWLENAKETISQDFNNLFPVGSEVLVDYGDFRNLLYYKRNEEPYKSFNTKYYNDLTTSGQFSVNPPNTRLSFSSEDLECDNPEKIIQDDSFSIKVTCTVKSTENSKIITPAFVFEETFGKLHSFSGLEIVGTKVDNNFYNSRGCNERYCEFFQMLYKDFSVCSRSWNTTDGPLGIKEVRDNYLNKGLKPCTSYLFDPTNNYSNPQEFIANIATTTIPYSLNVQPAVACTTQNTPATPSIITATTTVNINTTTAFGFAPNNASTTFRIDWGDGSGFKDTTNPVNKKWTETGTSKLVVEAQDTSSLCVATSSLSITVKDPGVIPNSPLLSATEKCGSIDFSWNSVPNATSYSIKRVSDDQEIVNTTELSYTLENITSEDKVDYVLYAINGDNFSEASNSKSVGSVCAECNFSKYHNKIITTQPLYDDACNVGTVDGDISYSETGKYWSWTCKIDEPNGHTESCQSKPPEKKSKVPDITLRIQPKIHPSCVATFTDKGPLKDLETCVLYGPSGSRVYTYNTSTLPISHKMSATSTKVGTRGTYRLECGENEDNLILMNTDVCISNPTTIER
jgi:hypothetical protein